MTVREQLVRQVAAIRAGATPTARMVYAGRRHGHPFLRAGEVTLECRCDTPRMSVMRGVPRPRVNAAEICGAEAGHLLVVGSRTLVEYPNGLPTYRLTVRLQYADRPWNLPGLTPGLYPTADLDALLDALEPGAEAEAGRGETWHDRPGML
jgi:hypothetical protein